MKPRLFIAIAFIMILFGCKKLIEIGEPQNQLTSEKVFLDSNATISSLLNVYAMFEKTISLNITRSLGMYVDELGYTRVTQQNVEFLQSHVDPNNIANLSIWKTLYSSIYACNDIIAHVKNMGDLGLDFRRTITNEAKFLRAYSYFILFTVYGNVPLVLTTNVNINSVAANSDSSKIFNQIISDLKDAEIGLPFQYRGQGRVRANKYAATTLLARVSLWQKDWVKARKYATEVINSGLYNLLPSTGDVFLANNRESILSFWAQYGYTADATSFIPSSGIPQYPLTSDLINTFEPGDLRKLNWTKSTVVGGIKYFYPYKYKNRSTSSSSPEFLIVFRLSELYLIRAEANTRIGETQRGIDDLNKIRNRAGLPNTSLISQSEILTAILQERRVEFFAEWGQRFLDLKGNGLLNKVIGLYKTTWMKDTSRVLPIPQNEITHNPYLKQNYGY